MEINEMEIKIKPVSFLVEVIEEMPVKGTIKE